MSENKIAVPDGMREAGIEAWKNGLNSDIPSRMVNHILEAALRWQADNTTIPTQEQYEELHKKWHYDELNHESSAIEFQRICHAWIQRMYDASEPKVPEEIKYLLWEGADDLEDDANKRIIEAYRLGKKDGAK